MPEITLSYEDKGLTHLYDVSELNEVALGSLACDAVWEMAKRQNYSVPEMLGVMATTYIEAVA